MMAANESRCEKCFMLGVPCVGAPGCGCECHTSETPDHFCGICGRTKGPCEHSRKVPNGMLAPAMPAPETRSEFEKWLANVPSCLGYPKCDGDLVGTEHDPECPMSKIRKAAELNSVATLQAAYAAGRRDEETRWMIACAKMWHEAGKILPVRAARQVKTALHVLSLTCSGKQILCLSCGRSKCDLCKLWNCC